MVTVTLWSKIANNIVAVVVILLQSAHVIPFKLIPLMCTCLATSPCTGGTDETLPVHFDHSTWTSYADVAVRMANLLTKLLIERNNTLRGVSQRHLFDIVRTNVDSDSLVFGSAIAVEEFVYPKYRIFCPYAYKTYLQGGEGMVSVPSILLLRVV